MVALKWMVMKTSNVLQIHLEPFKPDVAIAMIVNSTRSLGLVFSATTPTPETPTF